MNIFYGNKHHTSPIIHWAGVVEKDLQKKQDLNIERQLQVVKCGKYIPVGRNKTQRLRTRNTSDTLKRTRGQRIVSPNHIDGLNQLFTVPGSLLLQPMYHSLFQEAQKSPNYPKVTCTKDAGGHRAFHEGFN